MSIKSSEVVLLVAFLPNVIPGREAVLKQQSGTSFSTRASSAALLATAAKAAVRYQLLYQGQQSPFLKKRNRITGPCRCSCCMDTISPNYKIKKIKIMTFTVSTYV